MESVERQDMLKVGNTAGDSRDYSLCAMFSQFYNRKMLPIVMVVWINALIFITGAVWSGIQFFQAGETRAQILYAAIFICCVQMIALMKVFAWQFIHRNVLIREIRMLESRLEVMGEGISKRDPISQ